LRSAIFSLHSSAAEILKSDRAEARACADIVQRSRWRIKMCDSLFAGAETASFDLAAQGLAKVLG